MGGLEVSAIGVLLAVVTGLCSFFLGRYMRRKRAAKRQQRERAAAEAAQSRQVRRARERRGR